MQPEQARLGRDHPSCPDPVSFTGTVKTQNHPGPEHSSDGLAGGEEGLWPEGGKGQAHLSSASYLPPPAPRREQPGFQHPVGVRRQLGGEGLGLGLGTHQRHQEKKPRFLEHTDLHCEN